MRIIFVLTYPIHHAIPSLAEWLDWRTRDRLMPGIVRELGCEAELWGVGPEPFAGPSVLAETAPYPIRIFPPDDPRVRTRAQTSAALNAAARRAEDRPLFVLIGADGGVGLALHKALLRPQRRAFAVIIGGDCKAATVGDAALVLYESDLQGRAILHPPFWRRRPAEAIKLPKSIDTKRFMPADVPKSRDIIAVSRLHRYKRFAEIGRLARRHSVAVIGGGSLASELARRHPEVEWLGHRPHAEIPALLSSGRLFFHAGRRDYFPRAILEAMACGLPAVGLARRFSADVIPPDCGLRVSGRGYAAAVGRLLADPPRIEAMSRAARAHVVAHHGLRSSEPACRALIALARST